MEKTRLVKILCGLLVVIIVLSLFKIGFNVFELVGRLK